ncbi:MAG: Ldh family oxidoreductase, partial [Pseudomonadota bacterium]|nr:Ldh family oxidoreductase [Pseudomonadota bacterium]
IVKEQVELILKAWGMPVNYVEITSEIMIDTDLHGIDSHGIGMLSAYNKWRKMGRMVLDAPIRKLTDLASMCLIDGGGGLGHPIGVECMNIAITKATSTGVGIVTARHSNHFGAAGYYARMALKHNFIGVVMTGTPGAAVVPTFGKDNMLGTNPIAFAAPTRRNPPFVLDMATSTVAIGKLAVARRLGIPLEAGWALDGDGNPTIDPAIAREARKLTPLGGRRELGSHKGYGLAVMVDILSSTFSGADVVCIPRKDGSNFNIGNVGHFFLALDPAALRAEGEFQSELDDLIDSLRNSSPVDPGQPILIAGDPEWESFKTRSINGIPISDGLAHEVRIVAEDVGAPFIMS